jgi:hypothetical protein
VESQFPLPGVAVFVLSVGLAWLAFAGVLLLLARKFPNNILSEALDDLYGSGFASN